MHLPFAQALVNGLRLTIVMSIHFAVRSMFILFALMALPHQQLHSQTAEGGEKLSTWLLLQAVPSFTFASSGSGSSFGFEWEATPLLYSWGMSKLVSPWHAFFVEPTARFTGSVELAVTGQTFARKIGSSYFGVSVQFLGHIPLIERGEHLALNVGVAQYSISNSASIMKVIGISTLFGIVHFNLKQSSSPSIWMASLEFRIF